MLYGYSVAGTIEVGGGGEIGGNGYGAVDSASNWTRAAGVAANTTENGLFTSQAPRPSVPATKTFWVYS